MKDRNTLISIAFLIAFFVSSSFLFAQALDSVQEPAAEQGQEELAGEQSQPASEAREEEKNYPSKSLVQEAWDAYNAARYDEALKFAERCISLYEVKANELQASLNSPIPIDKINSFWLLNDLATAKFIKGKVLWAKKDHDGAKKAMSDVALNYKYAMAYDLRGWHWNVASAAKDALRAMEVGIDFGDSSSSFLTMKAWECYNDKDYKGALGYSEQCINMYQKAALWQQKSLTRYPRKEDIIKYWALNDVGTCCYIAGKSCRYLEQGEKSRMYFDFVKKRLYYASCWDPKGWFWKITDALKR